MHRCVLGGYLLLTKERLSLNTSKKDICNVKGEMVETGYALYLEGLAQILGRERYSVNICCLKVREF